MKVSKQNREEQKKTFHPDGEGTKLARVIIIINEKESIRADQECNSSNVNKPKWM